MSRSEDRPKCIRPGKQPPRRALYNGRLMTANEIAPLVGLSARTVRERISTGRPVTPLPRHNRAERYEFRGKMLTAREIAKKLNRSLGYVYHRIDNGLDMEAPLKRGRPPVDILESGEHDIGAAAGENGLYWEDDERVKRYHREHGGPAYGELTLREIGELWGLSHESIRQVEQRAMAKIRALVERGNKDALDMMEWMAERSERRRLAAPGYWEQASANAPGNFDLTEWNERTSAADLAARIGDEAYARSPHLKAAARGGKSAALVSRGKEPA